MDMIFFDLDGTLLNSHSQISGYTAETLSLLRERNIAYTVATGRTLHASQKLIQGQDFDHPHIYKNGVMIWHPRDQTYSQKLLLTETEVEGVLHALLDNQVTPFIFTLEENNRHAVYHPPLQSEAEVRLVDELSINRGLPVLPAADLPGNAQITNISALGPLHAIDNVAALVADLDHLVAYRGAGTLNPGVNWLDVHHSDGSKGAAVAQLKRDLGIDRVICFGDSDNDLSMFAQADEAYAPANSLAEVKAAATQVIGHHDEDGIAHFLRERFSL
jgi:hydroxymethylpyrimidine pyrophosphatase-like HAD family hydrolase